jgi:hypothetical protein
VNRKVIFWLAVLCEVLGCSLVENSIHPSSAVYGRSGWPTQMYVGLGFLGIGGGLFAYLAWCAPPWSSWPRLSFPAIWAITWVIWGVAPIYRAEIEWPLGGAKWVEYRSICVNYVEYYHRSDWGLNWLGVATLVVAHLFISMVIAAIITGMRAVIRRFTRNRKIVEPISIADDRSDYDEEKLAELATLPVREPPKS